MRHEEASRTTQRPALLRAAHQILDAEPKIHDDPLAVGLTPEASVESIRANERLIRGSDCMLLRSAFVLRARYAEDCLAAAALAGVSQYVILGAGMDTFAYRQPEHARAMRIFEVDHPSTQAAKRGCLAKRGLRTPANLAFVALDFEHDRLEQGLAAAGFDASKPTFFSWLGVLQYLTQPAIEETLRLIASFARGSAVTFSFCVPDDLLSGEDLDLATQVAVACAGRGEPWLSRHRAEEVSALATRLGFSSGLHLTAEAAGLRYFRGRSDGLRAPRYAQLFTATV